MTGLRSLGLYLVRVVKGNDAQGPEAAEHGEDGEAQVIAGGQYHEVVLALTVTGAVTLKEVDEESLAVRKQEDVALFRHVCLNYEAQSLRQTLKN